MVKAQVKKQDQPEFKQKILNEKSNIEGQFIFSIYKNTNYFYDYELKIGDFSSFTWAFYYQMIKELVQLKDLTVVDAVSVGAYVDTKGDKFKETYNKYGGYETIRRGMKIVEEGNIESYYMELQRYNVVIKLVDLGLPMEKHWDTYSKLSISDLNEVLEGQIAEAFADTQMGDDKVEDLFLDMDGMLKEADEGEAAGLPLESPLMNETQHGLALGNITMMAANSGVGKTFLTTLLHIQSSIRNQEPVLIIANEEERTRYAQALITAYINTHHKDARFNKSRFIDGNFTKEEWKYLREATQHFKNTVDSGLIRFVNMSDFSMAKTIRLVKKYARLYDVKYFILDTLKMDNDTGSRVNDSSWLLMQQNMVKLYNTIKASSLNVHIWVTAQMTKTNRRSRYLDQSMIGMSKNITDVVSSLMLTRLLTASEKSADKGIKVYDSHRHRVILDEDKDYMVVFWDKNRQGDTSWQIVLEVDRGLNLIRDIGITQIDNDLE